MSATCQTVSALDIAFAISSSECFVPSKASGSKVSTFSLAYRRYGQHHGDYGIHKYCRSAFLLIMKLLFYGVMVRIYSSEVFTLSLIVEGQVICVGLSRSISQMMSPCGVGISTRA